MCSQSFINLKVECGWNYCCHILASGVDILVTMDHLVEVDNLTFKRADRVIYDGISLKVPKGKITAVMGPSGIGKTTLLRLIGGQLTPDEGDIRFDGDSIVSMSRKTLYETRRRMSMLFQSGALFTDMSVFDNVAFPLREHTKLSEDIIATIVALKLQAVGLRGAAKLMPSELSGGMARRAALARAIALDPDLIMYDEPFAGQDPISMGVLVKLIRELNDALSLTSIVVTHDVTEVLTIADYIYILADKRVIGEGTAQEIKDSDSELVQQFLKGKADGPVPFHYPAPDLKKSFLGGVK
ncbi:ABC transporter ATP-binding protein [Alteromonas sp. KUL156]|nr:ABC transporter ATP-binding protein [Alteromonas sp. KUL154]GFD99284.1 ABC transporter ATP-binding protein [Alteromonas sp. KUL156]